MNITIMNTNKKIGTKNGILIARILFSLPSLFLIWLGVQLASFPYIGLGFELGCWGLAAIFLAMTWFTKPKQKTDPPQQ